MTQIKDGGPAFPRSSQGPSDSLDCVPGMSLRDWFAGTLEQPAVIAYVPDWPLIMGGDKEALARFKAFAECEAILRYIRADALIAERENGNR